MTTGSWQHLAVTVDQTNGKIAFFLNNKIVGTQKASNIKLLENSEDILIGRNTNSEFFNGMMDDVRLYSRVLSASELAGIFNYKSEGNLIAKYDFEKYDVDPVDNKLNVYDEGPHGYHGVLEGMGANTDVMTRDVGEFAIKETAFETLADEYVVIDGTDPTNKLQGVYLNNCTFAAWVKLGSASGSTYEPIISKDGVFSFGVNAGKVCLKLGDGTVLHELPMMSMPDSKMEMAMETDAASTDQTLRVVGNGYTTKDAVPASTPASSYFQSMGYRSFEWNFKNTFYDNSAVFKLHTVDASSKTANQFAIDDKLQMAAGFGSFSQNGVYTVRNWCRETNNEYWYLRAGYDGMEMPSWGVGSVPLTLTLKFKFLDVSNFSTSAVSILYGVGASDEGFIKQTWNDAKHENYYICGELYGNAATTFQMRCSIQEGSAGNGRVVSTVFTGGVEDVYTNEWNYMVLVHDPASTQTRLYLNHVQVCSVNSVATLPEPSLGKLRVGTFPIESANYVNRGIYLKGVDFINTAMTEERVHHYLRNRYTRYVKDSQMPSKGLVAHYSFDGDQPHLPDAGTTSIVNGEGLNTVSSLVEGSMAANLTASTSNLEISGEVFSSDKTFFFGTWINADTLTGYRPILSRTEGDKNMQFGVRNGNLEFSLSKSKPVSFTDVKATHILDYQTGARTCEVVGNVTNSTGGTLHTGLFTTPYGDLMKNEVKTFVESVLSVPEAIKTFAIPADSVGVSIASTFTNFFASIESSTAQPVEHATNQFYLLVLMLDTEGNPTVRSYALNYEARNNQTGEFASRTSEVYLSDGYTYSVTTMREANTSEEFTDWYLVMNYLRKQDEKVRSVPRAPKNLSSGSNLGYEGFPIERQQYDSVDIQGDFASETYETMDLNAKEYGPWGHVNNDLFGMLVDDLGDHGVELLFKGKTSSHDRVMNFSTGWSWLVDYFRNGFEVAPGGFNNTAVSKRADHTTYLPDETTTFPDNKMEFAMTNYPFYHTSYRNYLGADNNSYWSLDESAQNTSTFQQIWVRGRRSQAKKDAKPILLSGNDNRNKSLSMGEGIVAGEPYTMTLVNGDTVEMSACYNTDANKKVSNLFSHSMNDNNHSSYGSGDDWRALYTFKEAMEVTSMKFYQAESYQTKGIDIYYTTDNSVNIGSSLDRWTKVDGPSATEFHSNTTRTILRIDFAPVKAARFMIVTSKWTESHTQYGLMEWMIFGYDARGHGVVSDMSDKNSQHNNAGKYETASGYTFNPGQRSLYRITDTADPYNRLFLKHMSDNVGKSVNWNGNDSVIKAQLNNGDVIYYNCVHSYAHNTGWHTYDATNLFNDESVLNVTYQNAYTTYQDHGWMFARSDSTANRRTGSLIYEFANGLAHQIRGIRVWGKTISSKGFSANVRVFFSMSEKELEFVEFGTQVASISLLESDTSTLIDLGDSFPTTKKIMLIFESCWDQDIDVKIMQLQLIGKPQEFKEIVTVSSATIARAENVISGVFNYTNLTGKAKLYVNAYAYDYTGPFASTPPTMTLLPTSNKTIKFEINKVHGITGDLVPANAVNYIKVLALIEDSVYGTKKLLSAAYLMPSKSGEISLTIDKLFFDTFDDKVTADLYAYSSYAGLTAIYTLLTEEPVEEEDENEAKNFMLQNSSNGTGCVDYKSINVVQYGIASENFKFTHGLSKIGGAVTKVVDGRSYYLNVLIQDSSGGVTFTKRLFPTKLRYYDLERIFAAGHDSSYYITGFGGNANIRNFGEGATLNNWLKTKPDLVVREVVGGGFHAHLWCFQGDQDVVYSWGYNGNGELAYIASGSTTHNTSTQVTPIESSGITEFLRRKNARIVQMKSGNNFTTMLLSDGKMYSWGAHSSYATGFATTGTRTTITECDIFTDHCVKKGVKVVDFCCTFNDTIILFSDGSVWGIGSNSNGLLGLGHQNSTSGVLMECTSVNLKLEDGYVVDMLASRGYAMTYRLKNKTTGELSWWGLGSNSSNRLGVNVASPVLELTHLHLTDELISTFPDPKNYTISTGPTHWENCYIIDLTSNRFWFIGDATYLGSWSSSNTWVDRSAQVNMGSNKFVFCAPYSYGLFMGITNDRSVVYKVPDTRSIVTSNRLNVRADSASWSASTGLTVSGTVFASDVDAVTTYSFYATSNFDMTREQAVTIFNAGTSAALQSATLNLKEKVVLKDYMVRNIDVQGSVVPSISYSRYKLFVYAASATQHSMEVLTNDEVLMSSLFANVTEGSYDPFSKTLKVRASVTDNFNTPTNLYVAAFAEPPPNSLNNQDIKQLILNIKHLPQVQKPSVSGVGPEQVFLTNTLIFNQVFNSIYPVIDEVTYELMKTGANTEVVSQNSADNVGLAGSTSDATWYEWSDKYQSGQTVQKWTLQNGDSIYTNTHGEKWFDGNQTDDANYQPQMYNTDETWTVQGVSRSSVKSWRYFYNVAEPRTINCFKLYNHSTNGAHFINTMGVWNPVTQVYEPLELSSSNFPLNCFAGTSTSAYQDVVLKFEPVTLEPGRPLMIHFGKMATNLYINEMQLVYETPPPVIPTFFKYMKLHVRANNGSSTYFAFADVSVAHMEISNITTSVSTAHDHAISRIADNDPTTYHQTYDQRGFNVFLTFTHGLGSVFDMKFVNIWNNQGWKDVDVYVSTDNSNWMLSKEIRGLTYGAVDDMSARTTHVSCSLPPNVVTPEDTEYSIYAVAQNSVGTTSISKFTPPPTKKAYFFDRVKSMGYNNHFEAARGTDKTAKSFDVATEVTKFLDANPSIEMIDIIGGGHHTIFEVRNNGQQQFYGIGYNTQQGIGGFDDTNHQSTVVKCTGIHSLMNSEKSAVKQVACGWHHTMVLLENGKMYGFGYNGYGQLGTNNTSDGGKNGLESVMINDYCAAYNTEVLDFACTAYNTFVYLKNNSIRVAGRWNGHGQLGNNNISETNNTTFHHVSHMDGYLSNAKVDFMKCDYGSVMYRVVKNDTGEAKWYGAGQNTDKSIGFNGGQSQVIVECNLLNAFIEQMGLENNYEVVKGVMRSTILIDNRDGRLYGIGDFGSYNPEMNNTTSFVELTNTNGTTFLNYDALMNDSAYPMRVVKYATLAHTIYVGGTALTGPQPFEYLEPPTGNLNILRINNLSLTTPDRKGVGSLTLYVTGSILEDTRYYVVLTTDDRASYDFNDEANASSQATYGGVLPRNESLRFEVAVTEIPDISGNMTPLGVVSKVRAYVFVTDGTHRDYQVYDFGPYVSHPTSAVTSVSFSPITDKYQVDMDIGASKESVNTYNMVIIHPDAEFPDMGEKVSYDTPLIVDSYGSYHPEVSIYKSTVSGWVRPGERSLIKQAGVFDISINANGKMQAEIQSVYKTSHLERQVETPASSTLWRFKIYTVHGGHSDYATFTQLVLTDDNYNTYPSARYDQGADTFFDRVGTTNTNVYLYNHGHKVTYEYASDFTPTKMIWAYKATDPTRAPTRFLIQYCTTTNRTTEADWQDYVYVNLDVEPATNTTPTFHYLDINVAAPNTPRTLTFSSPKLFPSGGLELISPVNSNADDLSIANFIYMQSTYFADQEATNKRGPVKYIFNQTYRADGNIANYGDWHGSVNTGGIWAVFDLGSAKSVTHLRIWHSKSVKEMPHDFKIAMFDDTSTIDANFTNNGAVGQMDSIPSDFQYTVDTPDEHVFMWNGERIPMAAGVFGNETTDPMVLYANEITGVSSSETNGYHEFDLSSFNLTGRYMMIGFKHNPVTSGEYTKLQELRLYTALPPPDPSTVSYEHAAMTLDSSEGTVQFFKNGVLSKTFDNNHIRIPAVDPSYTLDTSADTRYLALRKGVLSKKNMINEHFSGREDLITLITTNSTTNSVNLPVGKYSKISTSFTSALESLETATSLTVVPEIAYRVLGVFTDVNGSVVFGDVLDSGTQYITVTYGWASGHNNGSMMMYNDGNNGSNMDFYPTKILNDFMSANPSYKCLNIEMGGYALMCMIDIDGVIKLYSTGYNAQGQVGNGNTSNQSTMVEAKLFNDYALENNTTVRMVRVGWTTTCVLYENGVVMCIGTNSGCYANGNDTASSTALVEASLVTEYCQSNNCEVVDFAIANGECCYLFSNGKMLGNGMAMGTTDNAHNLLKETALNELMGTDYECTLIRSMHSAFNFRLTHKTTKEEQWYGTGEQYYNGGGAAANQTYDTSITRLTKLEALLATFEDPSDYTYVMGCHRGGSFVRDNRTDTFWRIGYFDHIPQFGSATNFTETTTYITKEWCETNTHSRLTNFTPVYWLMNGYGIFAFGNPLGVEPDVIGGSSGINLTTMSIESVEGSFEPFPEPRVPIRHSDVGVANNHSTYTTSTESGMTYVQTLSNGDKAHSSATFVNERNVSQIFTGIHDNWSTGAWHGPSGTTTMSAIYEFTSGEVAVDTMNFVNVPGSNHWAGDIQILYWNGSAFVDVANRSAAGFSNAVHSEEISITFDEISSFKFKIVVDRHANNTTTYVGLSEWSIHGPNASVENSVEAIPNTLYANVTMNGSVTESTYYAMATLDSTMDMVRMKNLIATSSPGLVSGTLEKKVSGVTKSLHLKKVVDAHSNVYDLTAVPYAYLFVYLKDANGVEDFDFTAQIVRPEVDLSVPYLQVSSGLYDSGSLIVQGTLFSSSVLTGYYASAFQNSAPGDYLVSTTPTDLPTGESMVALSTSPNVPFVFSVTLDTVYADDTYASSSDIFGNEGQLALRLITTDGTTPAFKDFDYALGDFIVSTVAVYASTNDSITATVTKKNNTVNTKYTLFASAGDLTSKQILDIIVGKAFAEAKITIGTDTSVAQLDKVISLSEDKQYHVQDISKVSLYTLGTNHMPASVPGNVEIEVDGVRMPASTDTTIDSDSTKTPWILVLNYKNKGGGPIPHGTETWRTVEEGLPVFDDEDDIHTVDMSKLNTEHTLYTLNNGPWGHTGNDLFNKLAIALGSDSVNNNGLETRWVARTILHDRKIHFKSGNSTLMTALRTGSGNINSVVAGDHRAYADHTASIPQTANGNQTNLGNVTMTYLPLHNMSTNVLWSPERWAVDEGVGTRDGTWFQIWVRADLANCPQAMKDALIPDSTKMLGSLSVPFSIAETHVSRTMPSVNIGETEIDPSNRLIVKSQQVSAVQSDNTLYTFGLKLASDQAVTHIKNVSVSGGKYLFDNAEQPTITMYAGDTLTLVLNVSGHSLWIKTVNSTGTSNTVANVVNNGGETGIILWTPTASGTYYYNCEYHGGMNGVINVLDRLSMTHLNTDHMSALANHIFASDTTAPGTYTPVTASFNIRADSGYYYLNDVYQPTVNMNVGDSVVFTLDSSMSGHPLWIKTERSTGVTGAVSGVINNGANTGQISWTPTTAGSYYYNCQYHGTMYGAIVVTEPVIQTEFLSNSLSNVSTQTVSGTDIALFSTPVVFTDIFKSTQGDIKPLEDSDQNLLVVSLLKSGSNAGYVSRYAILQMDVDVSGADHGTNNGYSILTDVTENGFTHRNSHGTWDYYVKLNQIGLNGIGFNTGLVFEYKTDRATNHRYQPITLFQDQTSILSIYCSFYSNYFDFAANMSTSTQSALRAQIVLGNEYKLGGTTTLTISPKNGSLTDVTHMFHRFIFVDHETDPDLFDIVFEFLDQDRNLIFRSRMDYFHTNSASAFGGVTTPSNFSKSMTSFDLRVYSFANQTAIQYSDFSLTNKNAIRDSFTPLNGSSYPTNQTYSS